MGTTQAEIRAWVENAKAAGATHLIVACDTYDYEDYPVQVKPGEDVAKEVAEYHGKDMQKVMEVYAMHLDLEAQLREHRAWHVGPAPAAPQKAGKTFIALATNSLEHRIMADLEALKSGLMEVPNPPGALLRDRVEAARAAMEQVIQTLEQHVVRTVEALIRDACEECKGEKGGTSGNENIIDGRVLCDYCHSALMKPAKPEP